MRRLVLFVIVCVAMLATGCATAVKLDSGPARPIIEYVTYQEILTPLPLRVRLPSSYDVEHVLVLVRTWGSRDWQMVELGRAGQTWSGEVSCRQVSTVTGDTRYFFLALDEFGEVVATSGSPDWPHVATIVGSLEDGPQGLEGNRTPLRCHDPADCPPDFPGCPAYAMLRPPCGFDDDVCDGGYCAWDGYCVAMPDEQDEGELSWDEDALLARAIRKAQKRYKRAGKTRARQTRRRPTKNLSLAR